jgi:hypothetical protein
MLAVAACAAAAVVIVPHGVDAGVALAHRDDPVALADRALDRTFDAALAQREIDRALAAHDPELAQSFVALARDRGVALPPDTVTRVDKAVAEAATATATANRFAHGFITGEPDDGASLAGTAVGDLFVFGDIRDAVREGAKMASGEEADKLVLGLACVGIAITGVTYLSLGSAVPARAGLTVIKAARKAGRLSGALATWFGRSLRGVIDWGAMRRVFANASITEPALAMRSAREVVKVEEAGGLMHMVRDVGHIRAKAGTQAALDSLRVAETPAELGRAAKLAEKEGVKTRAIFRTVGRGALALSAGAFSLASWLFWAILTVFGLVASLKAAVERATERHLLRRKQKAARAILRREAVALAAHA